MLWNTSSIKGRVIAASDGQLGTVSDLLFDDASWLIRWLVIDTGKWLSGRKVLLPMSVLGHLKPEDKEFPVRLTMQQVKDSPNVDSERPVSRQMEANVYNHYGWAPYYGTGFFMGGYGVGGLGMGGFGYGGLGAAAISRHQNDIADAQRKRDDPHLRSIGVVGAYHIRASDGEIGHVEDFLVEEADWSVHFIVVDTKNWWPGKRVLISPRSAIEIDWTAGQMKLDVDRKTIKDSPPYDPSMAVDRTYETQFRDHYEGSQNLPPVLEKHDA